MAKCVLGPGCPEHGGGATRARRPAAGTRETARHRGPRPADLDRQVREAHGANALAHEIELLTAAAQRVMDESRSQRAPRYDGRAIIEAGKKERRRLIGEFVRGGMNRL